MSEDSEPEGFCACLKSPWKKITKGLKEINACNNCNIAINSNNVADSSNNSVNDRPSKTEINGKLEELLKRINSTENDQLKDEFNQIIGQIKVSFKLKKGIRCAAYMRWLKSRRRRSFHVPSREKISFHEKWGIQVSQRKKQQF